MMNSFEDMNKAGKDMMDNSMKSAAVVAKGMQTMAAESAEYAKKSFEDGTKAVEKMMAVKTIDKAFEMQTEYAKSAYEAFVAQTTKMTELFTSVAKDAYKPFEAATAAAVAKASK
jgi:phasin family protein